MFQVRKELTDTLRLVQLKKRNKSNGYKSSTSFIKEEREKSPPFIITAGLKPRLKWRGCIKQAT